MKQLNAVGHPGVLQSLYRTKRFPRGQAELRTVATRLRPTAGAPTRKPDSQADAGSHAHALGMPDDEVQLGGLLHHRYDVAADLLGQHNHFDVLVVLEPVADDGRLVVGNGEDGKELRLGAGLQAVSIGPAELEDLLHDLTLLIDLNGINTTVVALVAMVLHGLLEGGVDVAKAVLQNVREANEDGRGDAAEHQRIGQLL